MRGRSRCAGSSSPGFCSSFHRSCPSIHDRRPQSSTATPTAPPVAAPRPVRLTAHGIERVDDYGWLRHPNWREVIQDPSRLAPEIRAHLDAENNYSDAMLAPLAGLRAKLIEEMKGRIEQFDSGVPMLYGPYAYWSRYMPGAEQPQFVRAPRNGGAEQIVFYGAALAAAKRHISRSELTDIVRITGSMAIWSMRPDRKPSRCVSWTSGPDATCRTSLRTLPISPGWTTRR